VDFFRHLTGQRRGAIAVGLIGLFAVVAIVAPILSPMSDQNDMTIQEIIGPPSPPGGTHLLGTMRGGIDIFHDVVWGTRSALQIGVVVTVSTAAFGALVGTAIAYVGGRTRGLVLRIIDAMVAFPILAGIVLFYQVLLPGSRVEAMLHGPSEVLGLNPLVLGLIAFSWLPYARISNDSVSLLMKTEFVTAAKAIGAGDARIIARHLIPNAISPVLALAAKDVGAIVVLAAGFTFLGIPGGPLWGETIVQGRDWIVGAGGNPLGYWWTWIPATVALIVFGVAWGMLGDSVSDALDPRRRRARLVSQAQFGPVKSMPNMPNDEVPSNFEMLDTGGQGQRTILGMTIPQLRLLAAMLVVELVVLGIFAYLVLFTPP
jgi:peptide/nickel transport system permease protein